MNLGRAITALLGFGLFGFLATTTLGLGPALAVAALGVALLFPTAEAFGGRRPFLTNGARSKGLGWYVVLCIAYAAYGLSAGRSASVNFSLSTYFAFATMTAFVLLGGRFMLESKSWDLMLLSFLWLLFDQRLTSRFFLWPDGQMSYPFAALLTTSITVTVFARVRPVARLAADLPWEFRSRDFIYAVTAFLLLAALLLPAAWTSSFIIYSGLPTWYRPFLSFAGIFLTIALPEELIFRGVLQNLLANKMGSAAAIVVAATLFGFSHWNNGMQGFDWRYIILATVAGIGYGWAYQRSRSLLVPVTVHALVDTTWHSFFR